MGAGRFLLAGLTLAFGMLVSPAHAAGLSLEKAEASIRIATFNANLNRKGAGVLIQDIAKQDAQILAVAEIILRVRPDILLVNEIDHDESGRAVDAFRALLADGVAEQAGLSFQHRHIGPMNTGVPSGFDLNEDGKIMGARDAWGFGRFPGQYGMAVLSRFPIGQVRDFHKVRLLDAPWAEAPVTANGKPYYSAEIWGVLRLSSKSHWDVPVRLPDGRDVHLLASHPTPPVFDGPEDRNGLRNAAEVRFWIDYIDGANWMTDTDAVAGGLPPKSSFVVLGDLNADPDKGDGDRSTVGALVRHPKLRDAKATSPGAAAVGHSTDTADWPKKNGPGNLRVDYVLPSVDLKVTGSGVFWPAPDDPLARLIGVKKGRQISSDHRLVWVDIAEVPRAAE